MKNPKKKAEKAREDKKVHVLQSTVFRLFAIVIVMVLPVNIVTLVLVQTVITSNENTMRIQAENALEISMTNLTETLSKANRELQILSFDDASASRLEGDMSKYSRTETLGIVADVSNQLADLAEEYMEIDMVYFCAKNSGYNLMGGYSGINREDGIHAVEQLSEASNQKYGTTWVITVIDEKTVLMGFNRWRGAEFGVLVNLDRVLGKIALPEYEEEYVTFFADPKEQKYTTVGTQFLKQQNKNLNQLQEDGIYRVYKVAAEEYGIELIQAVKQKHVLANMSVLPESWRHWHCCLR